MKTISKRTSHIFKEHYKETSRKRFTTIRDLAIKLTNNISSENNGSINFEIDNHRLIKCLDSYYLDVIRYKEYHCNPENTEDIHSAEWTKSLHANKKLNKSKVAALTAKWLLKYSPINATYNTTYPVSDIVCHINQYFALHCSLYILLEEKYIRIKQAEIESIFYDFKYRPFDERAYFSRFELLEQIVSTSDTTDNSITPKEATQDDGLEKSISKKTLKIFIASPSDVKNLRNQTRLVIKELNNTFKGKAEFEVWAWEDDKRPGHNFSGEEYQRKLMEEAGDYFDVFLMILWSKYGKYTISEYNWYLNVLLEKNKGIDFIPCVYYKNIPPSHANESTTQLNSWLAENSANWSFLGGELQSIKTQADYRKALRTALTKIILRAKSGAK